VLAGAVRLEARRGGTVVAAGTATVAAEGAVALRLVPVVAPPAAPGTAAVTHNPPPVETARGAWKRPAGFVALGIGAAGVLGAGAFFALRRGEESDLDRLCRSRGYCPGEGQATIDRSTRWGALSLVSFGVGAAGIGVGAFLLLTAPRSNAGVSTVRLGAVPVAGGALTTLTLRTF
jgi:hypothetical protein